MRILVERKSETADQALLAPVQFGSPLVLILERLFQHGRAEADDCRRLHRRAAGLLPHDPKFLTVLS